jgi:hypothetical protein
MQITLSRTHQDRSATVTRRGWLKRLEREAHRRMIEIPQRDGTVRRFAEEDLKAAFLNICERHGTEENAPPEHSLVEAARNSSDAWCRERSVYSIGDPDEWIHLPKDLSEP